LAYAADAMIADIGSLYICES